MAIKAVIFTDPECKKPCEDAIESMRGYIEQGELEVMDVADAIQQGYDLGNPEGVPFIGFISENTKKCITKSFFHDEEGNITLQRYGSEVEGETTPEEGEEALEAD